MPVSSFQRDPTQTILLRRAFEQDFIRRFRLIEKEIDKVVGTEDAFGLGAKSDGGLSDFLVQNAGRWQFLNNPNKVSSFKTWFTELVQKHLVTIDDANAAEPWLATYVKSSYRSGVLKSFIAAKRALGAVITGDKESFLRSAFDTPEAVSKVKMVYTRAYDELKGVTSAMDARISRVLGQALVDGRGPRETARTLKKEITEFGKNRARTLARTEIIHAHAEGQLDSLERLGINKVQTQVEWLTASNPCPQCAARSGEILTIEQARGLIPYHPNCRCAWAPYFDVFDGTKPKTKTPTTQTTIAKRYNDKKISAKAVRDKMREIGTSQNDVHRLVGAPPGSTVSLALNDDGYLVVEVKGKDVKAGDYNLVRNIKDAKTVENVEIRVQNKGTGFGSRVFVDQVQELQRKGFKQIETFAAKSKTYVGYNVWPKMGYDGPIPETVAALKGNPPPGGAKLISDLMKTAEGRAWWEENGRGVDLTFDLDKKSLGVKVLKAYAKKKGYPWSKNPTSNQATTKSLTISGTVLRTNNAHSVRRRPRWPTPPWRRHERVSKSKVSTARRREFTSVCCGSDHNP
jgi:SPP1 gp7 family putative phage head morphogenesis protein